MKRERLESRWRWNAAVAAFTPTVIFIVVPNNIVLRNLNDLPYSSMLVASFLACFLAGWIVSCISFALSSRYRLCALLARASLLLGLCVLLFDVVTALTQGVVRNVPLAIVIDVAVVAVAMVVTLRPRLPTLVQIFGVIGVVLLAQGAYAHLHALSVQRELLASRSEQARELVSKSGGRADSTVQGNIYHIILDGFQSEAYAVLAERDPAWKLDGFTYYPAFKASYFLTFYSVPEALTGRPYDQGASLLDWIDDAMSEGVWADLVAWGWQLVLYPLWDSYCSPLATSCDSTQAFPVGRANRYVERAIVDLWFVGLLPRSLRVVLAHGFSWDIVDDTPGAGIVRDLSARDIFSLTTALLPVNKTPALHFTHRNLVAAEKTFEKTIAEESTRPQSGQYVFVHAVIPHTPYALDSNCAYKGPDADPKFSDGSEAIVNSYFDQAECGLRLVQRFIDELKALDRFDQSLIIVHADHGMDPFRALSFLKLYPDAVHVEWGHEDDNLGAWRKSDVVGMRSHALLLVKLPSSQSFSISNDEVQMVDLAPTVLEAVGIPTKGYPGIPIQRRALYPERLPVFFAGAPVKKFFRGGGGTDRKLIFPAGDTFSRFVLENDQWQHKGDISVH